MQLLLFVDEPENKMEKMWDFIEIEKYCDVFYFYSSGSAYLCMKKKKTKRAKTGRIYSWIRFDHVLNF